MLRTPCVDFKLVNQVVSALQILDHDSLTDRLAS
jgi:hypothetical protein